MRLPIAFNRAAGAELIDASAWYATKRVGLAPEFMAEIDRCISLVLGHPRQFAVVRRDVRPIVANRLTIAFIFAPRNIASLFLLCLMAAETLSFGKQGANLTRDTEAVKSVAFFARCTAQVHGTTSSPSPSCTHERTRVSIHSA